MSTTPEQQEVVNGETDMVEILNDVPVPEEDDEPEEPEEAEQPSTSLVVQAAPVPEVIDRSFRSLADNKYYKLDYKGLIFQADAEGALAPIPRQELRDLVGDLINRNEAHTWWMGDTAAAIIALYGDEELAWFCVKIDKDEKYVRKMVSISKRFGFPNKMKELRHPDPAVTHGHHIRVMGLKDHKLCMELLNDAAVHKMNVADFDVYVKSRKAGSTEKPEAKSENGAFRAEPFRAFDPAKDNQDQYLEEFIERVKKVDFPEYINPELKKERAAKAEITKLFNKMPAELKAKANALTANMSLQETKDLYNALLSNHGEKIKIDKYIEGIRNADLKAEIAAMPKDTTYEDFKKKAVVRRNDFNNRKSEEKKIEDLVNKIDKPEVRDELFKSIKENGLRLAQVEPLVKELLVEQVAKTQADRVLNEARANVDKMFATKQKKDPVSQLPIGNKKRPPVKK